MEALGFGRPSKAPDSTWQTPSRLALHASDGLENRIPMSGLVPTRSAFIAVRRHSAEVTGQQISDFAVLTSVATPL